MKHVYFITTIFQLVYGIACVRCVRISIFKALVVWARKNRWFSLESWCLVVSFANTASNYTVIFFFFFVISYLQFGKNEYYNKYLRYNYIHTNTITISRYNRSLSRCPTLFRTRVSSRTICVHSRTRFCWPVQRTNRVRVQTRRHYRLGIIIARTMHHNRLPSLVRTVHLIRR
jgi:hypothetical protein